MPVKKEKKSFKRYVDKRVVDGLLNEIARKLVSLKHGYIANDELKKLREMVK